MDQDKAPAVLATRKTRKDGGKKRSKSRKRNRSQTPSRPKVRVGSVKDVQPEFVKLLYDDANPIIRQAFDKIESTIQLKREYIAYVGVSFFALYFIFGKMAQLFCNLIGFAYPAYKSVLAIRTEEKDDDVEWLTYWVVFACFTCFDCVADTFMSYVPIYWLFKVTFILYLAVPQTRGALMLYINYIDPGVTKLEDLYDEHFGGAEDGLMEKLSQISKRPSIAQNLKNQSPKKP